MSNKIISIQLPTVDQIIPTLMETRQICLFNNTWTVRLDFYSRRYRQIDPRSTSYINLFIRHHREHRLYSARIAANGSDGRLVIDNWLLQPGRDLADDSVDGLFVFPEVRRAFSGPGRTLLSLMIQIGAYYKFDSIQARGVMPRNQAFYQRLGFEETSSFDYECQLSDLTDYPPVGIQRRNPLQRLSYALRGWWRERVRL